MKKRFIILIVVVFVLLSALFYALSIYAPAYQFRALEGGNTIMALLSLSTWLMVMRNTDRPQAFVRSVYSASFLKLMVCMVSILVYVLVNSKQIHKPSVFVLFGIYAVYTIMETLLLSKSVRE